MSAKFTPAVLVAFGAISAFKEHLGDVVLKDVKDITDDQLPWARVLADKFVRGVYCFP
jgi:hypothetical protein